MTENAVIDGVYADFKFVKTRGVAQVVVEIPLERAATFVEMFGVPNPSEETWVAVARMRAQPKPEKPKERQRWEDMRPSAAAALACKSKRFQEFITERVHGDPFEITEHEADQYLKSELGIASKTELDQLYPAGHKWPTLLADFRTWQTEQRYGDMAR